MAIILLNKPLGVICQFTPEGKYPTLKDFIKVPNVYPAGRLDTDSEGLVVLTDDGVLQKQISHPQHKMYKTYWVQVEGIPTKEQLHALAKGVELDDFTTQPAKVKVIEEPAKLWERDPPIRFRKNIPTSWLEIKINEGKNRQVRRMTAKVGLPTLRLIRYAIGDWTVEGLKPGESRAVAPTKVLTP
jgi:23S rRNA pseudouridine2457 synthase